MFPAEMLRTAEDVLQAYRSRGLRIASAESCTGGLIAALLTEIAGSSDVFERGFVTYSDTAKISMLGLSPAVIDRHGAVSAAVAVAMADGALKHSPADVAVSVTGVAGPGGGTAQKPVGLVYIAVARRSGSTEASRFNFAGPGRHNIRLQTVVEALRLVSEAL
jgi:nicotinamide-nucleotide amidase